MIPPPDPAALHSEISFRTSRSSGAGGQNVNKVNTRAELRFNINESAILTEEQKQHLLERLSSRITKEGELILASEKTRSQLGNKEDCLLRFDGLIKEAFTFDKPRKATRPSYQSRVRRIETKKIHSTKKQSRKKPEI